MTRNLLILFTLFLSGFNGLAQGINIRQASGPIVVDGVMDEDDWQRAEVAKNFMQYFPFDSSLAVAQTEVRLTYDEKNLYIFATLYNGSNSYVTPSLRRDFRGEANDGFTVVIDTYLDKTNA
ncbi:MAG TPA: hydrolase, partial [Cyclobacteriaceae bacterium]|nr:hydrolase [Cyclobacteriaceae bacterium]